MSYRGKVAEQERARELRAQAWTIKEIERELGVSRSSVSLWVRDVELDEEARAARARRNFLRGNRAVPDPSIRKATHVMGCPAVYYSSTRLHREVMGLVHALLSCEDAIPG